MRPLSLIALTGWAVAAFLGGYLVLDRVGDLARGRMSAEKGALTRSDVERIVEDYIRRNPGAVADGPTSPVTRQPQQDRVAAAAERRAALEARSDEIFRDPEAPVGGNPQGDVSIVEFFDYNCPYCRQVAPMLIEAERTDKYVRFVYKEFPILGPSSEFAAVVALASRKQGKYIAFHQALMKQTERLTNDRVLEIANAAGLDVEQLKKDMQDPDIISAIERNFALAEALRITGTPGFIIGNNVFVGAMLPETLKAHIVRARQK